MFLDEPTRSVFSRRLRAARLEAGLSQGALGIAAGIDEGGAAVRINRYELAVHSPDFATVQRIGKVLNLPAAYFYCDSDELAKVIVAFAHADRSMRKQVLDILSGVER